jgi:hypothetical protein
MGEGERLKPPRSGGVIKHVLKKPAIHGVPAFFKLTGMIEHDACRACFLLP